MMFDEDQFPASALMPLADGPVRVLFRSYPKQPAAASAAAQQQTNSVSRFMIVALVCVSGTRVPGSRVLGSEKYTSWARRRARVLASRSVGGRGIIAVNPLHWISLWSSAVQFRNSLRALPACCGTRARSREFRRA